MALWWLRSEKPLTILGATPDIEIDIHGVKISAGLCGIGLATNEAGILNKLILRTTLKHCFDANWIDEIHDLLSRVLR